MSNSHQGAFVGNYPTPYRDGIRGEWMQECVYAVGREASEGLVITSLVTPHHWKVNSAGIPKWCAIRTVMTWCSSGTACPWYPRAFGNTACLSALLLTSSHSAHVSVFALVHLPALLRSKTAAGIWIKSRFLNNCEVTERSKISDWCRKTTGQKEQDSDFTFEWEKG